MQRILIDKSNLAAFSGMLSHTVADRIIAGQETGVGIVANTDDGESIPAGALSFCIEQSFVRVTWVYVVPQWRRTGFAAELLRTAIEGFLYEEYSEVSAMVAFYPENAELDALFTSCGFELLEQEGNSLGQTTIEACFTTPLIGSTNKHVVSIPQLSAESIINLLHSGDIADGMLEPNPTLWVKKYLPCSYAYVVHGKIKGLILFSMQSDDLYLEYIYSKKPEIMALPHLIESARKVLAASYPLDTPLYLATTSALSATIATKLLGEIKTKKIHIAQLDFDKLLEEILQYNG